MLNQLKDVFSSLQKHNVKYLVIGGIASVLYGVPRATFDLDILIEANPDNAQRLLDALRNVRLGTAFLTTSQEILQHEITIFSDWVRIDVQTSTPGIVFDTAWENRETMAYQGQEFYVVSKLDLIASKTAAGRQVDLEDVRLLTLDDRSDEA
ncbi:MAG: nucleotidyltransferase [Anaerolineales bacterium]|nr:nucleotidyltransferase [Anaerolineales bacterium]